MKYYLTSIDTGKNRKRFYRIVVQPGLFGNFELTRYWGRIGTKGRKVTKTFESMDKTNEEVEKLLRIRERHGYVM